MCIEVFIGSEKKLPIVDNDNGFYTWIAEENMLQMVMPVLKSKYIHQAGSFMGCACGLSYDEAMIDNPEENYSLRKKDVNDFIQYLKENTSNNSLKLFCTDFTEFKESYDEADFNLGSLAENAFDLDQLIVYTVKS